MPLQKHHHPETPSITNPQLLQLQLKIFDMSTAPEENSSTVTSPPAKRIKTDSTADMGSTQEPKLLVKKLSDKGRIPTRGSAFAAGYDIYAAKDTTVPARGKVLVDTDISIACPAGTCRLLHGNTRCVE